MRLFDVFKTKSQNNSTNAQPRFNYEEEKKQTELYLNKKIQSFETMLDTIPYYKL